MRVKTKALAHTERLEVTAGFLPIVAALVYLLLTI